MKYRLIRLFPLFLLLLCTSRTNAQREIIPNQPLYDMRPYHFGFILGTNQYFFTVKPSADLNTRMFDSTYLPDILPLPDSARLLSVESLSFPGFVVGIVGNASLGKYFDLRFIPSLSFGERELIYSLETFTTGDTSVFSVNKRVPSTYVEFPLELKYKSARLNNVRAYLLAGAKYSIDLSSQAKKREQKSQNLKIVKLGSQDISLEAGVGFDFYTEFFKFGIELKMCYGLFDVLKREQNIYTDGIAKLNSKIFQISLSFE